MENTALIDSNRIDAANPFFLHHSDNPGLVLVAKPLTGDNYASWERSMTKSLNAKNKLGFVNGIVKAPSQIENPDDYASWSRCNDMVHSWIINSLAADIADSVIYYSTAREIWEDLRERFSLSNAPRIYEIQRDIAYLRQDQMSVAAYYTKLKGLWDELSSYNETCQCGGQQDRQKLMQFLMGLNDSYSVVRGQVLLMNPLPSVRQAYSSISGEERQRNLAQTAPQSMGTAAAMVVQNEQRTGYNNEQRAGFNEGGQTRRRDNQIGGYRGDQFSRFNQGHRTANRGGGNSTRRPHCVHCNTPGHYIEQCYQIHGYPHGHPKSKERPSRPKTQRNMAAVNHVSDEGSHPPPALSSLSHSQIQQIMGILNGNSNGSEENTHKANVTTTPGSGYEEDDWFG